MGNSYHSLGAEISTNRKIAGTSQEKLAGMLGVARTTISDWETNRSIPSPENLKKLFRAKILDGDTTKKLILAAKNNLPIGKFRHIVSIKTPRELVDRGCRFGLNVARIGANDKTLMQKISLNMEIAFEAYGRRGDFEAVVGTSRNRGFQYKCFIDLNGLDYQEVKTAMTGRGFIVDDSPGSGKVARLWFLLPDEEVVVTPEGIRDNYFYPE